MNWAREEEFQLVGRGSGAGCLVAYVLGITDIDPLRFGLLFERFLNPERVSPPDFDIDFCMRRRGDVIEYVREKYGRDCVANIITFGTFGAKMVVRDVARVRDLPYAEADKLAKRSRTTLNISLEDALEKVQFRGRVREQPDRQADRRYRAGNRGYGAERGHSCRGRDHRRPTAQGTRPLDDSGRCVDHPVSEGSGGGSGAFENGLFGPQDPDRD